LLPPDEYGQPDQSDFAIDCNPPKDAQLQVDLDGWNVVPTTLKEAR